jgi:C-terminal processing protease CtpA/Prc
MSFQHSFPNSASFPLLATFAILLSAGAMPADAQQRVEITTRRPSRAQPADSNERQLKRLQHELDSLTSAYNDGEALTAADRRRVERDLDRTVERLVDLSIRMGGDLGAQAPRPGDMIRIRLTPEMANRSAAAMSRALMQVKEAQQAMPTGWIGFVAEGPNLTRIEDGELVKRFLSYPRIISVDPSSPAQRAGLIPSDTLVAYDGRDVRENDISLTRLLRPNMKVSVRVRRDGKLRDIPVIVATAPSRIVQRRGSEVGEMTPPWSAAGVPEPATFPRMPMPPGAASGAQLRVTVRVPQLAPAAPSMPAAPAPGMYSIGLVPNVVAGAQLTTITPGLGRTIGVSNGVLVTSAPVGSPANESGLTDGDVIVKVAGQAVRTVPEVRELVRLAAENGEHSIELEIRRQKRGQKLLLRW